ncbi:HTH-like domain-containing protein [Falsiruegeria mediterranea]|uniref:HTH-like domain-containing protein n=1 Tax=Falsiruegeria mediterranea M17 TaxID=1200281 RepID=A0A2R8C5X1_9RHOB|nr:hypothetical protein [Falsiruegeria mediterranea]SPJ27854.1 hypothetical protein TRM7615_01348 [Falsiruegeria mediterranea M17]
MKTSDLAAVLERRYKKAADKETAVSIHLFGIEFASELANHRIEDICKSAEIPESYATEIRKGMNLAKYVTLKDQ